MPTNAINDTGVKYLYDKLHGEIEPIAEAVSDSEVTIEGNPLNFNTLSSQNAKSTILSVEPIQDLHGFDKPWVGGAGKNLLPMTLDRIKTVNTTGTWSGNAYTLNNTTFTIMVDNDNNVIGIKINSNGASATASLRLTGSITANYSGNVILNGSPTGSSFSTHYLYIFDETTSTTPYADTGSGTTINASNINGHNVRYVISVISGASVDNKIFYPMLRLSTESDATFQPYTNECPITGRTEIGILGCGKNFYNILENPIEQGSIASGTGQNIVHAARIRTQSYTDVMSNTTYELCINYNINNIYVFGFEYDENYVYLGRIPDEWQYIEKNGYWKFTTKINTKYIRFAFSANNSSEVNITPSAIDTVMLMLENDDTTYSPYTKSNDLIIDLGQTVYGGTLDVENGVLVVDRASVNLIGNSSYWSKSGVSQPNRSIFWAIPSAHFFDDCVFSGDNNNINNVYMRFNCYEYTNASYNSLLNKTNFSIGIGQDNNGHTTIGINVSQSDADTVSDFATWLGNNPIQCVYPLATPITINLTPHTINLLKGVNNISTDGDKITLTYRDGSVATLGDLTSAVDSLDSKIDESKILTDTATGDKYILVVTNGVLSVEQISN